MRDHFPALPASRLVRFSSVCAIAASAIIAACGGDEGEPSTSAPRPLSAVAERIRDDGLATLQSRVLVEFPEKVTLALDGAELIEAVSIQTVGSGQFRPDDVLVRSVTVSRADATQMIIETSELVSDGAELRIHRSALAAGAEGSVAIKVDADLSPFEVPYASLPLIPSDPTLFTGGSRAPLLTTDRDRETMRSQLAEHLDERGSDADVRGRALAAFDAMPADIVTSPKLAASLASLVGTFAEPALNNLFSADNCTGQPVARVAFEPPPDAPALVARVTFTDSGARVISVNPDLEGEVFQLLAPVLAHEAIHCDLEDSLAEEIAATAFDAFLYLHFLAAEPWLATEPTVLARNYNNDALAMINSGSALPESVGLFESPGAFPVLQGSDATYGSFAEYVVAAYAEVDTVLSPTEDLAIAYTANLAAIHDAQPQDPFNLDYLDLLLGLTIPLPVFYAAIDALALEFEP